MSATDYIKFIFNKPDELIDFEKNRDATIPLNDYIADELIRVVAKSGKNDAGQVKIYVENNAPAKMLAIDMPVEGDGLNPYFTKVDFLEDVYLVQIAGLFKKGNNERESAQSYINSMIDMYNVYATSNTPLMRNFAAKLNRAITWRMRDHLLGSPLLGEIKPNDP